MSTTYGFTNKYLTKDEKPWFPVMGEIHFSRYRADLWEESLRKMKAGGLSIASVYVIWIHHEEEEG
ncbi:MAG: beta-galactosidase, partial [Lachnospiraceae bacterium]